MGKMIVKQMTALFAVAVSALPSHAQDAVAGKKVFEFCQACHVVEKDVVKVGHHGPNLYGVVGRVAGTESVYSPHYSEAMIEAGKSGVVWDGPTLREFIRDPRAFIKGTSMINGGIKNEDDITDLIAYLSQFSG